MRSTHVRRSLEQVDLALDDLEAVAVDARALQLLARDLLESLYSCVFIVSDTLTTQGRTLPRRRRGAHLGREGEVDVREGTAAERAVEDEKVAYADSDGSRVGGGRSGSSSRVSRQREDGPGGRVMVAEELSGNPARAERREAGACEERKREP